MRPATLDLVPHALHVVQVVGLVAVLGEHGCSLLSLLYLPSSELPLGSLAVHKPAGMQQSLLMHHYQTWLQSSRPALSAWL